MTREEAIKILKAIRVYDCYPKSAGEETKEAIEMAIEALEQGSCDKYIKEIDHLRKYICKLEIQIVEQKPCEDIAKAFQLGLAFGFGEKHDEMDKVIDEIKKVITPQPKMGHWIESDGYDDIDHFYTCSECGRYIKLNCGAKLSDYPYCHCGAKMEVEE